MSAPCSQGFLARERDVTGGLVGIGLSGGMG